MSNLSEFFAIFKISIEFVSFLKKKKLEGQDHSIMASDRIHATIKKTFPYKFKNDLFERKRYSFGNIGDSYRTTRYCGL